MRITPLPGGPGRMSAALALPSGEKRVLKLEENVELFPHDDRAPVLEGDYGSNGGDLSWATVGAVPLAMNRGLDLVVEGVVQKRLSERLNEYVSIWHDWRPDLFQKIEIRAEAEISLSEDRTGSVVAFSGGIDSLHTLRHVRRTNPGEPVVAVMLWGFDHSKEDPTFLDYAGRTAEVLADNGIRLILVETNWKKVGSVLVAMDYAAGLASALHGFGHVTRKGFCGADYHRDQAAQFIPIGHNPVTDPLLSSDQFPVETVGYDHTRIEKCEDISSDSTALSLLRVCNTYNCGVCEKCQRTRWGLFAVGCDRPPTFGRFLPLPRPWISSTNEWRLQVLDGMWTPILKRAEHSRTGTHGLRMLRIQHRMIKWDVENRGPWRVPLVRRVFVALAGFEKRVRAKLERLRHRPR